MTYKEAWNVVRVWTMPQCKNELPALRPSFVRDICEMRLYQPKIYREIRDHVEGPRGPCGRGPQQQALGRVMTYAALKQRMDAERKS